MRTQEPPHNVEAEQAVLACMMMEANAIVTVCNILEADDFYREAHKLLFTAMESLANAQEDVNMVSLHDWLSNHHQLDAVGGLGYIGSLNRSMPTTAQVEQYARIVKEQSLRRKLIMLGRTMVAGATGADDAATQMEQAINQLSELQKQKGCLDFIQMDELLDCYINHIDGKNPDPNAYSGISVGYGGLDSLTNGLQRTDFIILAARPSMGKTAMALNFIVNILLSSEQDYHVGLFSMEMNAKQIMNRLIANLTSIDSKRLDCNSLAEDEWARVWKAREYLNNKYLFIDSTGGLTITNLRSRARRLQLKQGLDILFIDYLQLMSSSSRNTERHQAIAEISRELKAMARELNIPVIARSLVVRLKVGRLSAL